MQCKEVPGSPFSLYWNVGRVKEDYKGLGKGSTLTKVPLLKGTITKREDKVRRSRELL